jgi:hypothetical protein
MKAACESRLGGADTMPCPMRAGYIWGATAGILRNLYEKLFS